ncbi:hypothetical protein L873DRAFT_127813 [Choiromyces venosus 120613-1]|uniref:Uncharacterized protein n=1 Tax=Choiromyces venosus 120613-1 TaxID=1336337 RepID=A0A3N4J6M9_9PEZI|nr:hypothetical protein L873DRAFT_127813 [Choiromyces venosus 120613-1]
MGGWVVWDNSLRLDLFLKSLCGGVTILRIDFFFGWRLERRRKDPSTQIPSLSIYPPIYPLQEKMKKRNPKLRSPVSYNRQLLHLNDQKDDLTRRERTKKESAQSPPCTF